MQSVAMSAVMAMTGWLLIMEHGGVATESATAEPFTSIPVTQALIETPEPAPVQSIALGTQVQQAVTEHGWAFFSIKAPAHANGLHIQLESLSGDADLYAREGEAPEGSVALGGLFDASSATQHSRFEEIRLSGAADQQWYIAVHGYSDSRFILKADIN